MLHSCNSLLKCLPKLSLFTCKLRNNGNNQIRDILGFNKILDAQNCFSGEQTVLLVGDVKQFLVRIYHIFKSCRKNLADHLEVRWALLEKSLIKYFQLEISSKGISLKFAYVCYILEIKMLSHRLIFKNFGDLYTFPENAFYELIQKVNFYLILWVE